MSQENFGSPFVSDLSSTALTWTSAFTMSGTSSARSSSAGLLWAYLEPFKRHCKRGALAEIQQAQQALDEARQQVLESLGEDATDAEGNPVEQYADTPLGKAYREARQIAAHAQSGGSRAFEGR